MLFGKMLLRLSASLVVFQGGVALAVQPLEIINVHINYSTEQIEITGHNLLNGGVPEVSLGEYGYLVVDSYTNESIMVSFPDAGLLPGDYLLTITTGGGTVRYDDYALTVSGTGPAGEDEQARTAICNLYDLYSVTPVPTFCEPEGEQKIVFVTSGSFGGNLGGIEGAHQKCQQAAESADLPGTYYAWIGLPPESAYGEFWQPMDWFSRPLSAYVTTGGEVVAGSFDELVDSGPQVPIVLDENGQAVGSQSYAWTNVSAGGEALYDHYCDGWTSNSDLSFGMTGLVGVEGGFTWSAFMQADCSQQQHLYCFQQ